MPVTETINFANLHGFSVGRYKLQNLLGYGAMGNVYKSRHPDLQRDIAVKILHPHHTRVPGFVERFRHEAAATATLIHPNIIQVFDFDVSDDGLYYMVMQYINGPSLEEYLSLEQHPLSPSKAYELITPIVGGLHYAHRQGIIHRDVKPGNIILDTREHAYLGDFGLAKIIGASLHTQSGLGAGTPAYMAPEQIETASMTPGVDIYALGVMLYKMLTTKLPFDGENIMNLIMRKSSEPPLPPSRLNPDIPTDVEAVILKAIAREPEARYGDAVSFVVDLRQAITRHVPDLPPFDIDTAVSSGFIALPSIKIDNYKIQREFANDQSRPYQRYLARNEALESTAVLTVLRQPAESDAAQAELFQNRLAALSILDHPGLASITRTGQTAEQRPFVAYKFVPGKTLAARLNHEWSRPDKCLPITASMALIRAIAEALDVVHQTGLVHNELTPEHIILQADNQPVIVGLEIPMPPTINAQEIHVNTPDYVPPELYSSKRVSVQSNIYSLGIMLYELLSGHRPSMPLWNLAHYAPADVPPASPLTPNRTRLAPETNVLIGQCLATDEGQRFVNMTAFLAQLDAAIEAEKIFQEEPTLPPTTVPLPPRTPTSLTPGWWRWWYVLVLMGFLLLLAAGFMVRRQLAAAISPLATGTPTAVPQTPSATATSTTVMTTAVPAVIPSASATPSPSITPTQTATARPSPTASQTPTNSVTASPTVAATATATAACTRPANWVTYTTQTGDTFFGLATATGTTVSAILQANCLDNTILSIGQRLWLPYLPATPTAAETTPSPTTVSTEPEPTAVFTPLVTAIPTEPATATPPTLPTLTPPANP